MGFLDKAKQAATELQQKADVAMANSGLMGGTPGGGPSGGSQADRALRDLGILSYLEAQGRPASGDDHQRVMDELRDLEAGGRLDLSLSSVRGPAGGPGTPTPPPPPGAVRSAQEAGQAPPPPGSAPPPAAPAPPAPGAPGEDLGGGRGTGAPPPPPSWS